MKPTDFAKYLSDFFGKYLPGERGLSKNSIMAYRDTFVLLIRYYRDEIGIPVSKLTLDKLTQSSVSDFLKWLQNAKNCCSSTRNARLAAIKSFLSYLEYENPVYMFECQKIRSIPLKKAEKKSIKYLTIDGIKLLLQLPNRANRQGRRDFALLALLYDTGARVQEIADLMAENIRCTQPYTIKITGKGQKTRIIPLLDAQVVHLFNYMKENHLDKIENSCKPLFTNNRKEKLTRGGIAYILAKYISIAKEKNPALIPNGITCHSIRHSKAMHLLQADVPLIYIRDILGHESVLTTEIYARADSRRKREVLTNAFTPIDEEKGNDKPIWLNDDNLLEWLNQLK